MAAAIHLTIPRSEIRSVMGPGLGEIMSAVKAQGIGPAGPWFTHHLKMDPATFDFEICVPVSAPVAPVGRVEARVFPAVRVARTIYRGEYERLGQAWGEFGAWIAANGHSASPDLFECYLAGPESSASPGDWRTELCQPLVF
jgi:effector-binding domain-containing protein